MNSVRSRESLPARVGCAFRFVAATSLIRLTAFARMHQEAAGAQQQA